MGHLKDIANQPNLQTFPGATFQIAGTVPASQCSDPKIAADDAYTSGLPQKILVDIGAFAGYNLVGKVCTITASVGGRTGDFDILSNTDDVIFLQQNPDFGNPVTYFIHNGGELILTRNLQSFAEFIHTAGYAYTIKGSKLYTNIPSAQLQYACRLLYAPLT